MGSVLMTTSNEKAAAFTFLMNHNNETHSVNGYKTKHIVSQRAWETTKQCEP